jgi:CheY-like chemotaxis protein
MANILIIDDRAVNRQFLTTLLGYQKHELREASDGAEGLRVAREMRPDHQRRADADHGRVRICAAAAERARG